ncbi:MAG: hypothetical protein J6Y64_07065 [Ruminococcus sp.]|nr:hypothetical protein [Ruminococcus sp.]
MKVSEEFKKELRHLVRELLLLISLPLIIVKVCLVKEYFDKHYTHFNAERTALMERTFDITVDDSVKLKRYSNDSILIAINEELELETDDYERFIAENVNTALKLDESRRDGEIVYKYVNFSTDMKITALEKGGYLIALHHWD